MEYLDFIRISLDEKNKGFGYKFEKVIAYALQKSHLTIHVKIHSTPPEWYKVIVEPGRHLIKVRNYEANLYYEKFEGNDIFIAERVLSTPTTDIPMEEKSSSKIYRAGISYEDDSPRSLLDNCSLKFLQFHERSIHHHLILDLL